MAVKLELSYLSASINELMGGEKPATAGGYLPLSDEVDAFGQKFVDGAVFMRLFSLAYVQVGTFNFC